MAEGSFDFNKGPRKILADTVHAKIVSGLHHITFQSGIDLHTFVLPLPLSKLVSMGILRQVEEIEKKTGRKIDVHLPPDKPVPSPWTASQNGPDFPNPEK